MFPKGKQTAELPDFVPIQSATNRVISNIIWKTSYCILYKKCSHAAIRRIQCSNETCAFFSVGGKIFICDQVIESTRSFLATNV